MALRQQSSPAGAEAAAWPDAEAHPDAAAWPDAAASVARTRAGEPAGSETDESEGVSKHEMPC